MPPLKTKLSSYTIIESTSGTDTESIPATTGFVPAEGGISGGYDFQDLGTPDGLTEVNMLSIIVYGTGSADETATIAFFAAVDGGPPEYICTVDYIFGTGTQATGVLWADTATVTSYHTTTIQEGGATANDIKRLNFDFTGFRYIKAFVTATNLTTGNIRVLARYL